ncbi:hypothetical protein N0V84_010705 [Fusarium piperis]|uniref:Exonuclease V n=1 Tax=Fusarium piperis TaxID=1435070 RepID=A0A9W8W408_9HYPO|nr:hypothetical protein N0V84_010705 [Fusarium piperis]
MAIMTPESDDEFDYDFSVEEEELLLQLASHNDAPAPIQQANRTAIDNAPDDRLRGQAVAQEARNRPTLGHGDIQASREASYARSSLPTPPPLSSTAVLDQEVFYPDLTKALFNLESRPAVKSGSTVTAGPQVDPVEDDPFEDGRSPLQRFRSYPKKPLTVSDLTSGAWCELQYWYTLTRLPGGRRTRTAAMKQGSKVHQKLEDEVHTTVQIDIMTKEDAFGLRLWNLVQGLRTLRDTGLTRELEVWGMVDDNLVNGIIDSASYENPNPEFEEELSSQESQRNYQQTTLTDYFPPKNGENHGGPKIYLADVKTRGSYAPASNALIRPAKIQLLLYHRFLSDMAAGRLDFLKVFRRYGLDPDDAFSDTFIAQVGSLHDEIFVDASDIDVSATEDHPSSSYRSSSSAGPDLLQYRTLRELIPLVEQEMHLTFPHGEHTLGHMLRVQYVHRSDGQEIDVHDFPVSRQALDAFLANYMAWWRGERRAKGVDIEEAFKCRTCEFASDCSWRQTMDDERLQRARAQQRVRAMRRKSSAVA